MATILFNGNIEDPVIEVVTNGEYEYGAQISEGVEVLFNDPQSPFSHLVAVRKDDKLIRFALQDASPNLCNVSGNSIIYPEAFEDTDVWYTLSAGEIKEDIMINSPAAPMTFTFLLENEGVVAQLNEDKSIDYFDSLTGERVWTVQAPYAVDAANKDVPVELDFNEGTYSLTVTADETVTYPIRLDPTITVGRFVLSYKQWYGSSGSLTGVIDPTHFGFNVDSLVIESYSNNTYGYADITGGISNPATNIKATTRTTTYILTSGTVSAKAYVSSTGSATAGNWLLGFNTSDEKYLGFKTSKTFVADSDWNVSKAFLYCTTEVDTRNKYYTATSPTSITINGSAVPNMANFDVHAGDNIVINHTSAVVFQFATFAGTSLAPQGIEDTADFDMTRTVSVTSLKDVDTYRPVTCSDEAFSDTARYMQGPDSGIFDTDRRVAVDYSADLDIVRRTKVSHSANSDTTRSIISTLPVAIATNADSFANSNGRKIVKNIDGYYYLTYKNSSMQISVIRSLNLSTWQDINFPIVSGYTQETPSIAADSLGNIHVVWQGKDAASTSPKIKYTKYDGTTWTSQVNVNPANAYTESAPSICVDGNDVIHVAYYHASGTAPIRQLRYVKSADGGTTWTSAISIFYDPTNYQYSPSITADRNNILHVVWYGKVRNEPPDQIFYSTSSDEGTTWPTPINVSNLTGYLQYNPIIVIGKNNMPHVIWRGTDSGSAGKYYIKHSYFNGTQWTPWQNVNPIPGYNQEYPSATVDPWGGIHMVAHSTDATNTTISRVRYAKYEGGSWTPWTIVSPGAKASATYPALPEHFEYKMPLIYAEYNEVIRQLIVNEAQGSVPDEADYDLIRRAIVNMTAENDTKRPISLPVSSLRDALRRIVATQNSPFDTYRPTTVTDSTNRDTVRRIVATANTNGDILRTLTALDSSSMDTVRRVLVSNQKNLDTIRRTLISDAIISDTLRTLMGAAMEAYFDLTRLTSVNDSSSADTIRTIEAFILAVQADYDLKRSIIAAESSSINVFRRLVAAENNDMDLSRRLVAIDWVHSDTMRELKRFLLDVAASYDMSRTLVSNQKLVLDTLRRAYGITGTGTQELFAMFLADMMGTLRLRK